MIGYSEIQEQVPVLAVKGCRIAKITQKLYNMRRKWMEVGEPVEGDEKE